MLVGVEAADDEDEVVTMTTEDEDDEELSTIEGRMVGTAGASATAVVEGTGVAIRVEVCRVVCLCLEW